MEKTSILYIGSKFSGHDSAIFVVFPDGQDVFAIETERLTRYKHDYLYPILAIKKLLEYKKINGKEIKKIYFANSVVSQKNEIAVSGEYGITLAHRRHFKSDYEGQYAENKLIFDRLSILKKFLNLIQTLSGFKILWYVCKKKLGFSTTELLNDSIKKHLKKLFPYAEICIDYVDHQLCHALSSYYASGFEEALLITSDGFGDNNFSSVFIAKKNSITKVSVSRAVDIELRFKNRDQILGLSPGIIYSYFTELLGFKSDSDEGKVEALSAYGNWDNEIYRSLIKLTWVSKRENCIIFDCKKMEAWLEYDKIKKTLGEYKREDIAAAVQKYLEDIHLEYIKHIVESTGIKKLCFSGGVAANVILNLKIFEEITRDIFIPPAMADDGTAQGAAIDVLLNNGYGGMELGWMKNEIMPYFSTSYSKKEVLTIIDGYAKGIRYEDLGSDWPFVAARMVAEGKIGAIFHGRMEWGPRALGNRSIIADPRRKDLRKVINLNIKKRPEFQPFCPSVLLEEKDRLFVDAYNNKHMTCAFRMKKEFWDKLPGAMHVDGTSRVQFVEKKDNPQYYRLLETMKELTGYGVVINTSFNKHGRTIVESPRDALVDFYDTNLDFLVIEGILIKK